MKAVDFFCGAGGLTRGLLDAGIRVVVGVDSDKRCGRTFRRNNPRVRFFHKDIREVGAADLREWLRTRSFRDVLFAGCAPCQPFSKHVKKGGRADDATLLGEFGRLISSAKPGYVLVENVPGMAKVRGNSTFRRFLRTLRSHGYSCIHGVLDAKHFGVPQNRRRLVLLASRRAGPLTLPGHGFDGKKRTFRTVRDAISRFPPLRAGQAHPGVPNHVASAITPLNLERLRHSPRDGGDRRSWPKRLVLECHDGTHEGHTDVYGRMAWGRTAPTLTSRCNSVSNGRYGHPEQDRAISLREAAALQSFPDGYVFEGSNKHIASQIGNAVPVRLAEAMGRHILGLAERVHKGRRVD